jgi:lipopolysaccharide heptosyltransferase II
LEHSGIQRILVIKLRAIGDVVLSTVVLKNLRQAFPKATLDFLTEIPSREAVFGNPSVDTVFAFNIKEETGLSLIMKIRRQRYDLVIDLFGNPRSAIVACCSGAKYRVGYRFGWRKYCYNIVIEPRGGEVHNTEFNLDALKAINVPVTEKSPFFPVSEEARMFADEFFRKESLDGKFVAAINPGGGWYTKRWRAKSYGELGKRLRTEFNASVIITWGPGEEKLAEEIRSLMNGEAILIPKTKLKELGAILERCSLMITNDSGPMHIAGVLGTPIVAIYGPTHPELQGPVTDKAAIVQKKELSCLGCNLTDCPIGNPCMEELAVETVLDEARKLITRLHLHDTISQPA